MTEAGTPGLATEAPDAHIDTTVLAQCVTEADGSHVLVLELLLRQVGTKHRGGQEHDHCCDEADNRGHQPHHADEHRVRIDRHSNHQLVA